jgi:hypothetical protein
MSDISLIASPLTQKPVTGLNLEPRKRCISLASVMVLSFYLNVAHPNEYLSTNYFPELFYICTVHKSSFREIRKAQLERLAIPRQKFKILHTPTASSSCVNTLLYFTLLYVFLHILVSGYRII